MRLKESFTTAYMTEHAHTLSSIYISECFNCVFLDLLCLFGVRSSQHQTISQVLTSLLSGQTGCSKAGSPTLIIQFSHTKPTLPILIKPGPSTRQLETPYSNPPPPAPPLELFRSASSRLVYSALLFFLAETPARDSSLDFHLLTTAWP